MNRRVFFLSIAGSAGCHRDERKRLNVLNWSDYVAEDTIPDFEREFHARVRYGTYESLEEMLARVMSGNSGWDVVFPTNYFIEPMRQMELLAPLDHRRLPNLTTLDAGFRSPHWDPELRWAVPYMWGATGILSQASLDPPVAAWADLWEPRYRGRLTMLDDPAEVLSACLKRRGHSLNSGDPSLLARAKEDALAQKPLLRAYINEIVRDQVVAGEVLVAQVWRSTAMRAMEAAPGQLRFTFPREGFPLYADNMAILRESRRGELAHAFLDYLMRPKVAARIVEAKLESTVNAAARNLLPPRLRDDATLFPPPETLARGEWFQALPAEVQRARDRIWTEIKSA